MSTSSRPARIPATRESLSVQEYDGTLERKLQDMLDNWGLEGVQNPEPDCSHNSIKYPGPGVTNTGENDNTNKREKDLDSRTAPAKTPPLTGTPHDAVTTLSPSGIGIPENAAFQQTLQNLTSLPGQQQILRGTQHTRSAAAPQGLGQFLFGANGVVSTGSGHLQNPQDQQPVGVTSPSGDINLTSTFGAINQNLPSIVPYPGQNSQITLSNPCLPYSGTVNDGQHQSGQPSIAPNQPANRISDGTFLDFLRGGSQPATFPSIFAQFSTAPSGRFPCTHLAENQNQPADPPGTDRCPAGSRITPSPSQQRAFQTVGNEISGNFHPVFPQSNMPPHSQQPVPLAPGSDMDTAGFVDNGYTSLNAVSNAEQPNQYGAPGVLQMVPNGAVQMPATVNQKYTPSINGQPNQFANNGVQNQHGQPRTPTNTRQTGQKPFQGSQSAGQRSDWGSNQAYAWSPVNAFDFSGPGAADFGTFQFSTVIPTQPPQYSGEPRGVIQAADNSKRQSNLPSGYIPTASLPWTAQPAAQVTSFLGTSPAGGGGYTQPPWFGVPSVPVNPWNKNTQQPTPAQTGFGYVTPATSFINNLASSDRTGTGSGQRETQRQSALDAEVGRRPRLNSGQSRVWQGKQYAGSGRGRKFGGWGGGVRRPQARSGSYHGYGHSKDHSQGHGCTFCGELSHVESRCLKKKYFKKVARNQAAVDTARLKQGWQNLPWRGA